jgi:predicted nucleic acid-binding protein
MISYSRIHYLDASALVKLVADDPDEAPGRDIFRKYYWEHPASLYATSFCFAEALSAFKGRYLRKKITEGQYIEYVLAFVRQTRGANLRIDDEISILAPVVATEVKRLIRAHKIDFIDCLQIVTIMHGQFKMIAAHSKILITADRGLAKAARSEGARVWECTSEPAPAYKVTLP